MAVLFERTVPIFRIFDVAKAREFYVEHHGDACPGSTAYVQVAGVRDLHAELRAKDHPYLRPGVEESPIGTAMELIDPFGNRLRINEPPAT